MKKIIELIKKFLKKENVCLFLGSTDILPPPLSNEEEVKYLTLAKEGDISARNKLIEHNIRLVVFLAKKYENTNVDLEDLVSIGSIGLIKAINTFKGNKNIKLATYASRCIENEILMFLRKSNKIKGEISIDEPLNKDGDGNELLLSEILGTDPDITSRNLEDEVDRKLLNKALEKLTERERMIIKLRFGINTADGVERTQKEVADLLGISQSYISRIEKKIIHNMKKEIKW